VVKTKINQKTEVQQWTSALFYVERKTFTGQQYLFFERYVQWVFGQSVKRIPA